MTRKSVCVLLILSGIACIPAIAQDKSTGPAKPGQGRYYKLTFRVIQTGENESAKTTHVYVGEVNTDHIRSEIRTGDRIPANVNGDASFQYLDVGTEIDTRAGSDEDGLLHLELAADISSVAGRDNGGHPVIRQWKWDSEAIVPIGKPTIVFSSDNVSDKGKTELELTATPIK